MEPGKFPGNRRHPRIGMTCPRGSREPARKTRPGSSYAPPILPRGESHRHHRERKRAAGPDRALKIIKQEKNRADRRDRQQQQPPGYISK
jgi:hypothetical protein